MEEQKRPKAGVAIIVLKDDKILLGNRKNSDGTFHWTVPGGKMEFSESFKDTALREIKEENGLDVEIIDENPIALTNDIFKEGHFITIFLRARYKSKEPEIKEPDKFKEWMWFSLDNLPSPLSPTVQNLLKLNINLFKIPNKLLERAVNPLQYDLEDVFWEKETLDSPTRKFQYDYLENYKGSWKNKEVLDVGCGTGWLMDLVSKNNPKFIEGIEPSYKNVKIAKKLFPNLKISKCDLESFNTNKKYDIVIATMVFNHILDLKFAFNKIYALLKEKGKFQMIIPDYDYFKKQRHNYEINFEELNSDEYVVQIKRENGKIADVVRKAEVYIKESEKIGFKLIEHVLMYPSKSLVEGSPKFIQNKSEVLLHLLIFEK